jgi:deazaflavin-dependent oxidoreductase (nitroreductase family)
VTTKKAPAKKPAGSVEAKFFRALNKLVEPSIRKGYASSRLAPGGIVVLETKGRRTGRRYRVPLAAMHLGRHVVVGTFRGRRSAWVKNVAADPDVRYWLAGEPRSATAIVVTQGRRKPRKLPPAAARLWALLKPYTHAGWAFAILSPRAARRSRKIAA